MSEETNASNHLYRFDDVTVDCENFRVQKAGENVSLTPRAFDVLALFLRNSGHVVDKQKLFEQVWKDTFVSDNALTKIIKEIRHALQDSADNPRYIETVPKRGYRFIADVKDPIQPAFETERIRTDRIVIEDQPSIQSPRRISWPRLRFSKTGLTLSVIGFISIAAFLVWLSLLNEPAPPSPIRSIAVLPFKPLNADSRDESLEMGMAEALITRLSNLKQIIVRPINAVRIYTDLQQDPVKAGKETQADAVLDGSIQKAGERVRVTVRLIDVRDGTPIWAEQFDENFTNIFNLQDSISQRVTSALKLRLGSDEQTQLTKRQTNDPEAYQLYLQGHFLYTKRDPANLNKSFDYYQRAIQIDPKFALAYVGIAESNLTLLGITAFSSQEAIPKMRTRVATLELAIAATTKALELDPSLAEAHNTLAEIKYQFEYDWTTAEKEFNLALKLNPNASFIHLAYGYYLMIAGRFDEAHREMEQAQMLDPSSTIINRSRGRLLYLKRQFDQAILHYQKIIELEPNVGSNHALLAQVYAQKGMYAEAANELLKSRSVGRQLSPEEVSRLEGFRTAFIVSGWHGFYQRITTEFEERAKTVYVAPAQIAMGYARQGKMEQALAWLEKGVEVRDPLIVQLKVDPTYDGLRANPRLAELIRTIGLQP